MRFNKFKRFILNKYLMITNFLKINLKKCAGFIQNKQNLFSLLCIKKIYLIIKNFVLSIIIFFFKFNIKFFYFVTHNPVAYLFYVLCMAYPMFGGRVEGFTIMHYLSLFVTGNIITTSFEVFLLCSVNYVKPIFFHFLDDEFISKYLTLNTAKIGILKALAPLFVLLAIEILTKDIAYVILSDNTIDLFRTTYGYEGINWSDDVKEQFVKKQEAIFIKSQGLLSAIIDPNKNSVTGQFFATGEFFSKPWSYIVQYLTTNFGKS